MNKQAQGWVQFLLVMAFLAGAFGFAAYLSASREEPRSMQQNGEQEMLVTVLDAFPQDLRITFTATGTVRVRSYAGIVPAVSGEVISINEQFYPGGIFEAEEQLFQINPVDYLAEVKRLHAEVARAQAELQLQEADTAAAIEEWKALHPRKDVPPLVAKTPQLAQARAALEAAQAQLESAKLDLQRTNVRLPYAGRVVSTDLELGQFATAGQAIGQVYALSALEVHVPLNDQQTAWLLETDQPAIEVATRYLDEERRYQARLKRVAAQRDEVTRFGDIVLGFETPAKNLVPGVFVDVIITGPERQNVWKLPLDVLQKDNALWVVNGQNTLQKREPKILYIGADHVIVQSEGEKARVVVGPLPGATEGAKVRIRRSF